MNSNSRTDFERFEKRLQSDLMTHPVITDNQFCRWFADANLTLADVRYFAQQFSVFSNLFLVAQLYKTINAVDLAEMHAAKEILANEIGCIFNRRSEESEASIKRRVANPEDEGDVKLVNSEGTVDGGTFRFKAAHFEWLLDFAEPLGLGFETMGKRKFGSKSTLFFCDELIRIYGSEDFSESAGASFAVENWAAAGFWKQLISGLRRFKQNRVPDLKLGFFTWHDKVEDQHKEHTYEELKHLFFGPHAFNEDTFVTSGYRMLNGVEEFWNGLNRERLERNRFKAF
jgi:hypothetical protein